VERSDTPPLLPGTVMGFAEPVIGRAFARPVGSTHPTKCAISAAARVIASPGSGQRNPALLQR